MNITTDELFSGDGILREEYMFVKRYGLAPSVYACQLDADDEKFDFSKIDKKLILSIFPDAKIFMAGGRHVNDEVSCVTRERLGEKKIEYVYGGAYAMSKYVNANVRVILDDIHVILLFDTVSVEAIYDIDSDIDIEKFCDDFMKKMPTRKDDEMNEFPCVGLVSCDSNGFYTTDAEINSIDIDIDKNYNDDFKPIYEDIVKFLGNDERKSGLVVLNGEPGTGKTYLIRHLIKNVKNNYILIPPSIAENLSSPEFITFLTSNNDSVFILEDCETVIKNRSVTDITSAVSSILNMSDGLMSDIFNGKFICTFNADMSTIDEAILRKGRCYGNYTFGKLDKEKVKVLLNEKGVFLDEYEDMTLADIYHYEDKNVDGKSNKKKIGF